MAWLAAIYLTYQLISIPFSLPVTANRFIGVLDGWRPWPRLRSCSLSSLESLIFSTAGHGGRRQFFSSSVTMVDLFGGYTFNIALAAEKMDVGQVSPV